MVGHGFILQDVVGHGVELQYVVSHGVVYYGVVCHGVVCHGVVLKDVVLYCVMWFVAACLGAKPCKLLRSTFKVLDNRLKAYHFILI